jgi:hypothetical protein
MRYLVASVVSAIASVAAWAGSAHEPISILAFGLAYAASVVLMEWSDARWSRTRRSLP